jgi:transposase InsO family protein
MWGMDDQRDSRQVLAWRLSNTLDSSFCVEALEEALRRYGAPAIFIDINSKAV